MRILVHNSHIIPKLMLLIGKLSACLAMLLLFAPVPAATAADIEAQRISFDKIESDLKRGRRKSWRSFSRSLRDYPLYPYLVYRDMAQRLAQIGDDKVVAFLTRYDGSPVADKLRHKWLRHRARRGRWHLVAEHYAPSPYVTDKVMPCLHAKALMRVKRLDEAAAAARALWLVGFSQPAECDEVFRWALRAGVVDEALVWRRILLVVRAGRLSLAGYLSRHLGAPARKHYHLLARAHRRPFRALRGVSRHAAAASRVRDVWVHAARRARRADLARARESWPKLRRALADYPDWLHRVAHDFGLAAARRLQPELAYEFLSRLPPAHRSEESRLWMARSALRMENWRYLLHAIALLDEQRQSEAQWRYWRARALHGVGRREQAAAVWRALAREGNYYGYLAADKIGAAYRVGGAPPDFSEHELAMLQSRPAVRRAYEFFTLQRPFDARRELNYLVGNLDAASRLRLAALCRSWGWAAGAVQALAHEDFRGELHLRYPAPWPELAAREARRAKVPEHWLYAVMRRESAFLAAVKSPAGALGLMQLMPATARVVARKLRLPRPSRRSLTEPALNLRLGAAYLKQLYQLNGGRLALALASYNAGYSRVKRWLATAPVAAPDVWVDTIPIDETRRYVRAVLFYTAVYQHQLEGRAQRLQSVMAIR